MGLLALPLGPSWKGSDMENMLDYSPEHIARIRTRVRTASGLGPLWREMMLSALNTIDELRTERNQLVDDLSYADLRSSGGIREEPPHA